MEGVGPTCACWSGVNIERDGKMPSLFGYMLAPVFAGVTYWYVTAH
jgi:hypothetical protein